MKIKTLILEIQQELEVSVEILGIIIVVLNGSHFDLSVPRNALFLDVYLNPGRELLKNY